MTAQTLIDGLLDHGVILTVVESSLEMNAPEGILTPAVVAMAEAHKPEMVQIIRTMYNGRAVPPGPSRILKICPAFIDLLQEHPPRDCQRKTAVGALYNPVAARGFAVSDPLLTPEQRSNLFAYAGVVPAAGVVKDMVPAVGQRTLAPRREPQKCVVR